jgi:predicted ArsR family transcriptional regulator
MRSPWTRTHRHAEQAVREQRERTQRVERERRILAALKALGPLNEGELASFLGMYWANSSLRIHLLDLAIDGQVVATKQDNTFVWRLPEQSNGESDA